MELLKPLIELSEQLRNGERTGEDFYMEFVLRLENLAVGENADEAMLQLATRMVAEG